MAESLLKRTRFLVLPCKRDLIIQGAYSSLPPHVVDAAFLLDRGAM